ncbi:hypothetical protein GCM10009841_32440 [Microlunatus panaciterrae]|uniref:Galactose mutarotase n=1 Tax=Microlunatus panaciterrae TaxID=400768 RepID=A0ABS2RGN4_9ACTN|nr:hypothetical protein [Microlunatus panaciterrae]MBM7797903.1 hypothetical protein [Microlunatus panaciterrae]
MSDRPTGLGPDWQRVPLTVVTDEAHGGRWTSLRSAHSAGSDVDPAEREWLWTNPAAGVQRERRSVVPGQPFVDAGGGEECFPTVRGAPDHGAAWSVGWRRLDDAAVGTTPYGQLSRRFRSGEDLEVGYRVDGRPGSPFLHAVHLLLQLSPEARLTVPGQSQMDVLDHPVPGATSRLAWPSGTGTDLSRLGPDDGTAVCALLPGCTAAVLVDRQEALAFEWMTGAADSGLCSLLLWRNLGGWPESGPYRSIGIEPMIGRAAALEGAPDDAVAHLDAAGQFSWTLRLSAWRR